ncbi:3'-5' exonuclease-like [Oryza glaberrima]|uniref:3'-5' exonuclease domain-containing protein n=2 Tax=Oryza TaxID=4527 RepID=A0A0D3FT86_9ORYZ|nr:3'-5' exonuclease-like [Oryza glaberrima]
MATEIEAYYDDGSGTYLLSFDEDFFDATLTKSGGKVESWLGETYRIHRSCGHPLVVGLDVEWRPAAPVPGPVAVLQLCIDRRCLVFQILHADYVPDALSRFLADPRYTFVGVGVRDDAARLRVGYGLEVPRAVDLRALAADTLGRPDLRRAGLRALVREVMGVQMDKPHHVRVSAWDKRNLSEDQFKYACADAFASREVGRRLYTCNCDGA